MGGDGYDFLVGSAGDVNNIQGGDYNDDDDLYGDGGNCSSY
jgi:hypothetical protein